MKVQILKRDGSLEDFEQRKIARVAEAAGLSPEQAKILAGNVAQWLESTSLKQVTHFQIRNRVLMELEGVDKSAAGLYKWYEKTKDKNPEDPLSSLRLPV